MILPIVQYGHPVLRQKGARVEKISAEIRQFIEDLLETMYEACGVGLASQQVARALQITVIDVREATDRPSTMQVDGKSVDVASFMPLVLINPEVKPVGETTTGGEGCLSFPEVFADITRPATVDVTAMDATGKTFSFRASGLLARAIQHETDHLHGILFIDRMTSDKKRELQPEIDEIMGQTKNELLRAARASKPAKR